ncbi:MAG: hypothetical protein C0403_14270 [Desulfobacterium sp.]|nr:hypothetical protein [Desulfobacterium sp.]
MWHSYEKKTLKKHYHVVVIGAGPSGIAAAVAASRNRCRTLLLEKNSFPGGLAAMGKISTICGLYHNSTKPLPEFLYDGFPLEFAARVMSLDSLAGPVRSGRVFVLHSRPGMIETTAREFLESQKNLDVHYRAEISGLTMDGKQIRQIQFSDSDMEYVVQADAVIDSTGDAVMGEMAGASLLFPDETEQAPALLFSITSFGDAFSNRSEIIRIRMKIKHAVDSGDLNQGTDDVSFSPDIGGGSATVKLNLGALICPDHDGSEAGLEEKAQAMKQHLIDFLQENVEGLEHVQSCGQSGTVLHRAGKRAEGLYLLTREDVLTGKQFPDAVARGNWPIEKYSCSGKPRFSYLPDETTYDIPGRCLCVSGIDNLFTAGKCISADDDAIASARVIGCCLSTGEAAGNLASQFVSKNRSIMSINNG